MFTGIYVHFKINLCTFHFCDYTYKRNIPTAPEFKISRGENIYTRINFMDNS